MPSPPERTCVHGILAGVCPACAQDRRDEHEAVQLAARDPEKVERLRLDFEAWLAGDDATRAREGDLVVAQ